MLGIIALLKNAPKKKSKKKTEKKKTAKNKKSFWYILILIIILALIVFGTVMLFQNVKFTSTDNQTINETTETIDNQTIDNETTVTNQTEEQEEKGDFFAWLNNLFAKNTDEEVSAEILNDDVKMESQVYEDDMLTLEAKGDGLKTLVVEVGELGCPNKVFVDGKDTEFKCYGTKVVFQVEFSERTIIFDYGNHEIKEEKEKYDFFADMKERLKNFFTISVDNETIEETTTIEQSTTTEEETTTTIGETTTTEEETTTTEEPTTTTEEVFDNPVYDLPYEEQLYQYVVENNLEGSFQYQAWPKNTKHIMNLSKNFIDPDSDDELIFSSTSPMHTSVEIEGPIVTLTPEENWHGVDYISFKATDSKGAQVITPEVALIVRDIEPEKESKFWTNLQDYMNIYLIYIIFGIVILIILVLIIGTGSSDNKKKVKKK